MKGKREALAESYIMEALLDLMKKKEYREISITEICERAGVTRMSFYRNFDSREDILKKWITRVTDRFLQESAISFNDDPAEEYFIKLFTHMEKYKDICLAMYRADLIHIVKEQFDRVFLMIHRDEFDEYKSYFLSGGVYNVFLLWLIRGCRESPQEMAQRMNDYSEKK